MDCSLQKLVQVTMKGLPEQKSDSDLNVRAYYSVRHKLTVQNGPVFKEFYNLLTKKASIITSACIRLRMAYLNESVAKTCRDAIIRICYF